MKYSIIAMLLILSGCGKKEDLPPTNYQSKVPIIYVKEVYTDSGVKCVTASLNGSVSVSCDWK